MGPKRTPTRPPSKWWLVVSALIWVLACASLVAAVVNHRSSTRPIGEGSVFMGDIRRAAEIIAEAPVGAEGVRKVRNHLEVEAVSLVDGSGTIAASTSHTLEGVTLSNPMLEYGLSNDRMAALAAPTESPLEIDGVTEWPEGSVLYQVVSPLPGAGSILVHYDVSQLLARRSQSGHVQPLTLQLFSLGGIFAVLGALVLIGHSRAARRHYEIELESDLLRTHSVELEAANAELAEARFRAERALAVAEEKMRIRSEFVLMINHELRTPLTSVVTGAELLRDGKLGESDRNEIVDSMVANGKRLTEIIDQILAVARIENRGFGSELSLIPLEELCAAAEFAVVDDLDDADLISVRTDKRTVRLIVGSLADNARSHGASTVKIHCSLGSTIEPMLELGERPSSPIFICVVDDGPGIDPEFLPRAFEKFEKNSFSSGTGLGLYVVRLMVGELGGSIGVHTTPKGTTFQVALPALARQPQMEPA